MAVRPQTFSRLASGRKFKKVMSEFSRGKLKSGGSGKKVTNVRQARAIAASEQREANTRKRRRKR